MNEWAGIRDKYVLLEDESVLVLNKPAGISVMGERHETDLVTLAQDAGEKLMPVHRIDKVTSGVVLFAKDLRIHGDLTRQFYRRSVDKVYLVVTRSCGLPGRGMIDLPLSVGRKTRVRVGAPRDRIVVDETGNHWSVPSSAVFTHTRTYPSRTTFARVWGDERHTVLAVQPITGRRHQIRVHLAWIGHPIEGDPLFDKETAARGTRTSLHSWRLAFDAAWCGGTRIRLEAVPGEDFWVPLRDRLSGDAFAGLLERAGHAVADLGHAVP